MVLLCIYTSLLAQVQEKDSPKVFKDKETGKIYWNRKLPVYINLSTEPGGKGQTANLSQENADKNKPYFFDTEGANFIRTRWKTDNKGNVILPKTEQLWPITTDGLAPVSKIKYHYKSKYVSKGVTYYDGTISFSIKSHDAVSGIERLMYSINSGEYKNYTTDSKINLSAGDNTVKVYGVDRVGNVENADKPSTNNKMVVDDMAPESDLVVEGPKVGNILSPKCVIKLSAKDDKSGVKNIQYHTKNKRFGIYSRKGITLYNLPQGENELKYFATDNVNNKEKENSYGFFVDFIGPKVDFAIDKDEYIDKNKVRFVSPRSVITLKSDDNKAGVDKVFYNFNGNPNSEYIQPIPVQNLNNTYNRINYTATDKVTNKSKVKYFTFNIDRKAPKVFWKSPDVYVVRRDTIYVKSSTRIRLSAYDLLKVNSGVKEIRYKIGNQEEKVYTGEFSFDKAKYNKLLVKAYDNVNNVQEVLYHFYVDNDAPEIYNHFSVDAIGNKKVENNNNNIFPSKTFIYLGAKDAVVGNDKIYYKINGGKEKPYVQPISGLKANKDYEVEIKAVDLLGNKSTKKIKFSISN